MLNILTANVPIDEFQADATVLFVDPMLNCLFGYKNCDLPKKKPAFGIKPNYSMYGMAEYYSVGVQPNVRVNPIILSYCKKNIRIADSVGVLSTLNSFISFDNLLQSLSVITANRDPWLKKDSGRFTLAMPTFHDWQFEEIYNSIIVNVLNGLDIDLVLIDVTDKLNKVAKMSMPLYTTQINKQPKTLAQVFDKAFDVPF
jgi:hypothetical protein